MKSTHQQGSVSTVLRSAAALEDHNRAPAPAESSLHRASCLRILGACSGVLFNRTHMQRLFVNPKYQRVFAAQGWSTFSKVFEHFLPHYARRRKMTVERITIPNRDDNIDAFFKLYHHRESGWSFWMRASKARREFDNYAVFERLRLSAAEGVACGEERNAFGLLERAFIITRTVPDAAELDDFFQSKPPDAERRQILRELAGTVRGLHNAHFYYHDLVWRNILVSNPRHGTPANKGDAGSRLFLIDCPRGAFAGFGRARKRLRDLASLDKTAARLCSRAERLRFLLAYLAQPRLDDEGRALVRACLEYRRTRWPEDWTGK